MKTKQTKPRPSRRSNIINEDTWFYESRGSLKMINWFKSQGKNVCASFKIPWKVIIESAKRCRPEEFTNQPQDNWIPASKPPTKSGWYIVSLKDWSEAQRALFGNSEPCFWLLGAYGDITSIVTHWMPLPNPPKTKTKKAKVK